MACMCFLAGRGNGQCLQAAPGHQALGSGEDPWRCGGCMLCLLAGPLAVAVTLREVGAVPRALDSGNGRVCVPPGSEGNRWCSVAEASSAVTPEVTGSDWSQDPQW